mgnify:FL=1
MKEKLVCGLGMNDSKCANTIPKGNTREYTIWQNMLFRCTEQGQAKNQAYIGCTVSDNFKSYTFFYEWCNKQVGFGNKDDNGKSWCLDKDILVKGNKLYSEDTCAFVPNNINSLFTRANKTRGRYCIGVFWSRWVNKYVALCGYKGKQKYLGYFNTEQQAFQAYKTFKEGLIRQTAEGCRDNLDNRVYEALVNYEVSPAD